jgi:TolB-like protein/tetratricopeptide (TPR) repeat protein
VTTIYKAGDFEVRADERRLLKHGEPVALGARAFDLLLVLIVHRDRVIGKDELMALVWPGLVVEESNLTVQVSALRKALGANSVATVPGRGYRFGLELQATALPRERRSTVTRAETTLPDRPSVAVLPFINLSSDPAQDYFADGMVDGIITALARMRVFFVIARNSSFIYKGRSVDIRQVGGELGVQYVLEGSLQKSANRLRITCQLIDTSTGNHVWADRFEGSFENIFDLQDQVTDAIVSAIQPSLLRAEMEKARIKPSLNLRAYELVLRALSELMPGSSRAAKDEALPFIRRALEIDPHYAMAKAIGAFACLGRISGGYGDAQDVKEGLRYAEEALSETKEHPTVLAYAGLSLASLGYRASGASTLGFRYDEAQSAIERALSISPNLLIVQYCAGGVRAILGEGDAALSHMERCMRISPLDPAMSAFIAGSGGAHMISGRYDQALVAAQRAILEGPNFVGCHRLLVTVLGHLERFDEAKLATRRLLELAPGFTVSRYASVAPYKDSEFRKRCAEIFLASGVPN